MASGKTNILLNRFNINIRRAYYMFYYTFLTLQRKSQSVSIFKKHSNFALLI